MGARRHHRAVTMAGVDRALSVSRTSTLHIPDRDDGRNVAVGQSLYQALQANAARGRSALAYRAKRRGLWKAWSWADVEREVARIHGLLVLAGVRPRDLVAVAGETDPRLYWYVLAIQRAGAVPMLLSSRASPREFSEAYAKAEFSVFVAGSEMQVGVAVKAHEFVSQTASCARPGPRSRYRQPRRACLPGRRSGPHGGGKHGRERTGPGRGPARRCNIEL